MQTSSLGKAALSQEEGDVLRAYRCPAGVWTISRGLTAASGVVTPRAGMIITQAESDRLFDLALTRYEPAVTTEMPGAKQPAFDAGVSFHWNTGAIRKASWVQLWREKAPRAVIRAALVVWNKGGGKVLPGLTARREREALMLLNGIYPGGLAATPPLVYARWGLMMSGAEITAAREGFRLLGYDPGETVNAVLAKSVVKFQTDHALTADGIVGRATLSTLQRRLDARSTAATTSVAAVPAAAAPVTVDQVADLHWLGPLIWAALAIYALSLAWRYRDVIAAKVSRIAPRLATLLRSF